VCATGTHPLSVATDAATGYYFPAVSEIEAEAEVQAEAIAHLMSTEDERARARVRVRALQRSEGMTCPYVGGGRISAPNYQLSNCTWFQEDACCTNPEVSAITEAPPQVVSRNPNCYAALNYLMCSPCSARQSTFYFGAEQESQ